MWVRESIFSFWTNYNNLSWNFAKWHTPPPSYLSLGVGSGRAGRVWRDFFILPDWVGFAKPQPVDHPLRWSDRASRLIGFSGRLRSGFAGFRHYNNKQIENQPTTNIIKSPQQNTHHNHKKKSTKNQQIQIGQNRRSWSCSKTGDVWPKSGEISPDPTRTRQIWRDLTKSGEISLDLARSHLIWNLFVAVELDTISLCRWWSSMRSPFARVETKKKIREEEGDWDRREWELGRRDSHGGGALGFWRLKDENWERVSEKNEKKKKKFRKKYYKWKMREFFFIL